MNSAELYPPLWQRHARIIAQIVSMTHESVNGAECIALSSRQQHETVIEILRRGARNMAAYAVGCGQLQRGMFLGVADTSVAHPTLPNAIRPASARKTNSTLRKRLKLGRRANTLKSCFSIA